MGFWSKIFGSRDEHAQIQEIADEIDRFADRFDNASDALSAALAREYAERIRAVASLRDAQLLRSEFLAKIAKKKGHGINETEDNEIDSDDLYYGNDTDANDAHSDDS